MFSCENQFCVFAIDSILHVFCKIKNLVENAKVFRDFLKQKCILTTTVGFYLFKK